MRYPFLCLLAVVAGVETFVDIALFGCKKLELLRRFRPFKDGTPAHDHLGDIWLLNRWEPPIRLPGAAMEDATTDRAAVDERLIFLSNFEDLHEPSPARQGDVPAG